VSSSAPFLQSYPAEERFVDGYVRQYIKNPRPDQPCPVQLETFTPKVLIMFLASLKTKKGDKLSKESYSSFRSGLNHLFQLYNITKKPEFESELALYFTGFIHLLMIRNQNSSSCAQTGKEPLRFELYKRMAAQYLRHDKPEYIFPHLFHVITWNLMCRASNATSIQLSHLAWGEDALQIYFIHMKNDQTGERPRDPCHVYANPLNPGICPVLTLGIYLICTPEVLQQSALFPGKDQYDRFRKIMEWFFSVPKVHKIFLSMGVDMKLIGTYSFRKGGLTWTASGSTACPSSVALSLRAGWCGL
jgi:hypothetical protein